MKKYVLFLMLVFSPLYAQTNSTTSFQWNPFISAESGFHAVMPSTVNQFDRWLWNAGGVTGIRFFDIIGVEAGYQVGGILYSGSGYTSLTAWLVGLRYWPFFRRKDIHKGWYIRAGYFQYLYRSARFSPYSGLYIHPGLEYTLSNIPLYLQQELVFEYQFPSEFNTFGQFRIGLKTGIRFEFLK